MFITVVQCYLHEYIRLKFWCCVTVWVRVQVRVRTFRRLLTSSIHAHWRTHSRWVIWKSSQPSLLRCSTIHCLPPCCYGVTGYPLCFTHVSHGTGYWDHGRNQEAGSKWSPTVVNQWLTSLGSSQSSQPLVNHGAGSNLLHAAFKWQLYSVRVTAMVKV